MKTKTAAWEKLDNGRGYVVEDAGMRKSGSFASKEAAIRWFERALDIELKIEGEYVEAKP